MGDLCPENGKEMLELVRQAGVVRIKIKKGKANEMALPVYSDLVEKLISLPSAHCCQSRKAGAEKQYGGGFRDGCREVIKCSRLAQDI